MEKKKIILALVLAAIMIMVSILYFQQKLNVQCMIDYIDQCDHVGWFLFLLLYTGATLVVTIPETIFAVGAGMMFNYWLGVLLVAVGGVLGAMIAFYISRYLLHKYFHDKISHTTFLKWTRTRNQKGLFWTVMLARINPLIPFNLSNYAFGLTHITAYNYFIATLVGILPASFFLVYVGDSFKGLVSKKMLVLLVMAMFIIAIIVYALRTLLKSRKHKKN